MGEREELQGHKKDSYEAFNKLPDKAKELYWFFKDEYVERDNGLVTNSLEDELIYVNTECESPIEKIMYLALVIHDHLYAGKIRMEINTQVEIKNYRVDFLVSFFTLVGFCKRKELSKEIIIECDGHEFHEKTKEQVIKNNNRDYELKNKGYDILHFSGSEIYNYPIRCAHKVFNYIENCFDRMMEEGIKDNVRS